MATHGNFFSALLVMSLVSAVPVFSAGAEEAGTAKKDPGFGNRQEYRACLDFQDRLGVLRKNLDDHVAENNNTMALLQSEAAALAEAHKTLSPFDQAQVDLFNSRLEEHNRQVSAANEQAERVKAEHEAYHKETIAYNTSCATLVVRLDDREAVQKERETGKTAAVAAKPRPQEDAISGK